MGSGVSRSEMGRQKLTYQAKYDSVMEEQAFLDKAFPRKMLEGNVELIRECLESRAGFSESTLISAMRIDPKNVQKWLFEAVEDVFTAVINKDEKGWESDWEWFRKHLFDSTVWVMPTVDGKGYLYQEMIERAEKKSRPMMDAMANIIERLKETMDWKQLKGIKSEDIVIGPGTKELMFLTQRFESQELKRFQNAILDKVRYP